MEKMITKAIHDSIETKRRIFDDEQLCKDIAKAAELCIESLKNGGRVLFCGNGGSAADAQHLAAELSGRFYYDRPPLDGEALHVNTSYMTAVANDYSYDEVFARLVQAKGRKGDVLVGLSTSGNSGNVIRAIERAHGIGMITIGMTGKGGGKMKELCTVNLIAPSDCTPRIQEAHILIGHILCELIEAVIFPKK